MSASCSNCGSFNITTAGICANCGWSQFAQVTTLSAGCDRMTAKADLLIDELVAASIAFGREREPDWQTRIEKARRELRAYVDEVEGLEEDSGSYDSLISDEYLVTKIEWMNEDELPENISSYVYSAMFDCSKVDFVRLFPFVTVDGCKRFLIELPEVQE